MIQCMKRILNPLKIHQCQNGAISRCQPVLIKNTQVIPVPIVQWAQKKMYFFPVFNYITFIKMQFHLFKSSQDNRYCIVFLPIMYGWFYCNFYVFFLDTFSFNSYKNVTQPHGWRKSFWRARLFKFMLVDRFISFFYLLKNWKLLK